METMDLPIGPYLDISDDRVFKNVFGRPAHKDLLIALLNLVIEEITIVELNRFKKPITALDNDLERFYFCIKHMWKLQGLPEEMQGSRLMHRLFNVTALESLPNKEKIEYIKYMTTERDIRNQMAYAREQGVIEGIEKNRLDTAGNFKKLGVPVSTIAEATGLTVEQVESL